MICEVRRIEFSTPILYAVFYGIYGAISFPCWILIHLGLLAAWVAARHFFHEIFDGFWLDTRLCVAGGTCN